jgi:hypothetical protein
MVLSGEDFYQGETRYQHENKYILGILAVIFLVAFFWQTVLFSRRRKSR